MAFTVWAALCQSSSELTLTLTQSASWGSSASNPDAAVSHDALPRLVEDMECHCMAKKTTDLRLARSARFCNLGERGLFADRESWWRY